MLVLVFANRCRNHISLDVQICRRNSWPYQGHWRAKKTSIIGLSFADYSFILMIQQCSAAYTMRNLPKQKPSLPDISDVDLTKFTLTNSPAIFNNISDIISNARIAFFIETSTRKKVQFQQSLVIWIITLIAITSMFLNDASDNK